MFHCYPTLNTIMTVIVVISVAVIVVVVISIDIITVITLSLSRGYYFGRTKIVFNIFRTLLAQ